MLANGLLLVHPLPIRPPTPWPTLARPRFNHYIRLLHFSKTVEAAGSGRLPGKQVRAMSVIEHWISCAWDIKGLARPGIGVLLVTLVYDSLGKGIVFEGFWEAVFYLLSAFVVFHEELSSGGINGFRNLIHVLKICRLYFLRIPLFILNFATRVLAKNWRCHLVNWKCLWHLRATKIGAVIHLVGHGLDCLLS